MSVISGRFEFAPSRRAAVLIGAGGAVAIAALWIIPIPAPLRLLASVLVGLLFFAALRRQALLRGARAVGGLEFGKEGRVTVLDRSGNHLDIGKVVYAYVSVQLCTVVIQGGNHRYEAIVMPDSLPAEEFRHLRIQLGVQSGGGAK